MRDGVTFRPCAAPRPRPGARTAFPREAMVGLVLAGADLAVASACLLLGELVVHGHVDAEFTWTLAVVWPFMLWREGLYPAYGVHRMEKLRGYVHGILSAFVLVAVVRPFLFPDSPLQLGGLVLGTALMLPLMYVVRVLTQRVLRTLRLWGRGVVVLGAGKTGSRIVHGMVAQPLLGLVPVAVFDDDARKVGTRLAGVPVMGELREAQAFAARHGVDHAVLAIPSASQGFVSALNGPAHAGFRRVQIVPDLPGLPVATVQSSNLSDVLALEVRNNLALRRNQLLKRAFDLVVAGVGTLLISPVLATIALAIRLDSRGPVLYRQERIGARGRRFHLYKFRSMVSDADDALQRHLDAHPELRAEWEANHKLTRDPRVTRVGAWLRKTSLDELPQLLNVFRGEMSLVGPRPIVDAEIARYDQHFDLYTMVRPGMTGYWQVSGRSDTAYARRVELDGFYIRNWSIWFDFVILFATVRVVLKGDGAY